jgi:dihydroorotase
MIHPGVLLLVSLTAAAFAQDYDFLIKNGHEIDGRNHISAIRDVAIKDGKIAAVASNIPASRALKTVDAAGLYVTPGLVDIHVHVFPGLEHASYDAGDWGLYPDGFTLRVGSLRWPMPAHRAGAASRISRSVSSTPRRPASSPS